MQRRRVATVCVKGRGDASVTSERLDGLVSDLWHRGLREVRDIVLDDSFFDREEFGPGWEQETSDKAWAAGVGALSLNHNSVSIYMAPGNRAGARARIDVEPDTRDYFTVWNEVVTVRQNGRRKLRPHTLPAGEKTRIEVAEDLLAEMGLSRGSYTLKNGSGLNDTNRFSARQIATLLSAVWKRFPIAAEFMASLGIAARDGTMRLRMEGTDAAGRLRAKTGTLERVTALSGYVQSLGGERFVFSVLVNDWAGKGAPVISSIDRLGGMLAALGV